MSLGLKQFDWNYCYDCNNDWSIANAGLGCWWPSGSPWGSRYAHVKDGAFRFDLSKALHHLLLRFCCGDCRLALEGGEGLREYSRQQTAGNCFVECELLLRADGLRRAFSMLR